VAWAIEVGFYLRETTRLLRRVTNSERRDDYMAGILEDIELGAKSEVHTTVPTNFRILPAERILTELDMGRFWQVILRNFEAKPHVYHYVEGGIDTCINLLKEIVRDGT
jgi:hypothetical protein